MSNTISENIRVGLLKFLKRYNKQDILATYLHYLSLAHGLHPVLYTVKKTVYKDEKSAISQIQKENPIWRNTKVLIRFGGNNVNSKTKKVYICPFCGKAFGDNTHPSPQDAIYDWVSNCPKNVVRKDGLPDKRFLVSEDPEIIAKYREKRENVIDKEVFSSTISSKIFYTKESLLEDFKQSYLKPISLVEVQKQNRFKMDNDLLRFMQEHFTEEKISQFMENVSQYSEFKKYVEQWV